jgi:hypothetical protein
MASRKQSEHQGFRDESGPFRALPLCNVVTARAEIVPRTTLRSARILF